MNSELAPSIDRPQPNNERHQLNHEKPDRSEASQVKGTRELSKKRHSTDEYDALLWRIRARVELGNGVARVVGVAGCSQQCGVSTTVANLAIRASAHQLGPVLLIDANHASPHQHQVFQRNNKVGLANVLIGDLPPSEAIQSTNVDRLDLMPIGSAHLLQRTKIITDNYVELMLWTRQHYSAVFIDLPPLDDLRYASPLALKADMVLVAIRSESIRRCQAEDLVKQVTEDGIKIGGSILTRKKTYTPRWLLR